MFQYECLDRRKEKVRVQLYYRGEKIQEPRFFKILPRAEFETQIGEYLYEELVCLDQHALRHGTRGRVQEFL
jgi:hypothetical protein